MKITKALSNKIWCLIKKHDYEMRFFWKKGKIKQKDRINSVPLILELMKDRIPIDYYPVCQSVCTKCGKKERMVINEFYRSVKEWHPSNISGNYITPFRIGGK